ncbi:thioredoxin-like protein [Pelagophyceae sp. CCMP2097]|nr:thioredoxin-like protein [Pelagophyceae sp. CCMP2097]
MLSRRSNPRGLGLLALALLASMATAAVPRRTAAALPRRDALARGLATAAVVAAPPAVFAAPTGVDGVVEAVGGWLVIHPAPPILVDNPLKRWLAKFGAGDYDIQATRAKLEEMIVASDVVIFSATYCPFSRAAKSALTAKNVAFTAYEWNTLQDGAQLVAELAAKNGRSSIPAIFIAGVYVGGCNDGNPGLRPLIAQGGLEEALARCNTPDFRRRQAAARASLAARS